MDNWLDSGSGYKQEVRRQVTGGRKQKGKGQKAEEKTEKTKVRRQKSMKEKK